MKKNLVTINRSRSICIDKSTASRRPA